MRVVEIPVAQSTASLVRTLPAHSSYTIHNRRLDIHCWWIIVECIHHPTRGVGSKSQEEHANCHQKLPTEKKTELETLPSHFSLLSLTKSAPSCPSNRRTGGSLPSCGSEECTSPITLSCVRAHRVFLLTFVMHAGKAQPLAPGCMENFYTQAY